MSNVTQIGELVREHPREAAEYIRDHPAHSEHAVEAWAQAHPADATRLKNDAETIFLHPQSPEQVHLRNAVVGVVDHIGHYEQAAFHNGPRPSCPYGNCGDVLGPHDIVGTTFYIACNMMLAFTMFFFVQATVVPRQWKTSVTIAGLVTGVAWYNYTYMKDQWIQTQQSPTVYRYTDWLITVPLQITEFYFILKSSGGNVPSSLGSQLFLTSIAMVFFGWLAEIDIMAKLVGFVLGCACWLYIVYSTFAGEASQYAKALTSNASKQAFGTLRVIVSLGWTIYPIGFAIAYLCYFDQPAGVLSGTAMAALNITYNLADLINKGAFGLCCWSAAVNDRER